MTAIAFGLDENSNFNFGFQEDVVILRAIAPIKASFYGMDKNMVEAMIQRSAERYVRKYQGWLTNENTKWQICCCGTQYYGEAESHISA